jgi:hypothetical protein
MKSLAPSAPVVPCGHDTPVPTKALLDVRILVQDEEHLAWIYMQYSYTSRDYTFTCHGDA